MMYLSDERREVVQLLHSSLASLQSGTISHTCNINKNIVSWGNFGHLRALFLFWPSNSFGMGFCCPRS